MPVPTPPTTPSTPPLAPQRVEPTTFSARMDAWLSWFNSSFWVWVYDLVPWIQARANETEAWSNSASASAAAAGVSQTVAAEATATATAAITTVTQQAAAAAATSAAISSVATAASTSASAASASSAAAASYRDQAVQAWAAASAPSEQLAAQSASLHYGAVVKAIVYDTSKDSDGGAWRKRCNDKSWYNETLGGTSWIGQRSSEAVARAYGGALGANLITNGTFASDVTGWTYVNGASCTGTLTALGGKARIEKTDATTGLVGARWTVAVTAGKVYKIAVSAKFISGASVPSFALRTGSTVPNSGSSRAGSSGVAGQDYAYEFYYLAATTETLYFWMINSVAAGIYDWDDAVIQEQAENLSNVGALYQSTADGKFYKLNTTSGTTEVFRGISREFPAVAGIVAEASRVVIYDLTQTGCPMWMVFSTGATGFYGVTPSGLAATNGTLVVGFSNVTSGALSRCDFVADALSFATQLALYKTGAVAFRNSTVVLSAPNASGAIINRVVNDVAVTVLDSAPIDPATGLPVPTILVGTAGGLSIIKDDRSVVTVSFSDATFYAGFVDAMEQLIVVSDTATRLGFIHVYPSIPSANITQSVTYVKGSFASEFYAGWSSTAYTGTDIALSQGSATAGFADVEVTNNYFVRGSAQSLQQLHRNPRVPGKGMVAVCTTGYTTGWQVGDICGAYLADTVAETVSATDVVTNGTFITDTSGWSPIGNATLSVVSGELQVLGNGTTTYPGAAQLLTLVVGKTYQLKFSITTANTLGITVTGEVLYPSTGAGYYYPNAIGDYVVYFTASAATRTLQLVANSSGAIATNKFDNVSCNLCVSDRSVKAQGLVVNGTLTKTAVASGANLVAYSGWGVDPSDGGFTDCLGSSNATLGPILTSDFCVMGWQKASSNGVRISTAGPQGYPYTGITGTGVILELLGDNKLTVSNVASGVRTGAATAAFTPTVEVWQFYLITRVGDLFTLYLDGVSVASVTFAATAVGTGLWISNTYSAADLALWRFSATVPSSDQIAHIYRTELPLFQANAQCTLAGSTNAITAMSYDDATNLLSVSTAGTTSRFKDLLRVSSDTSTAGTATSVSAAKGMEIVGGSTGASIYTPAVLLRDELNKPTSGPAIPQPYRQFSVKDQQVFQSQAGVKVVGVYVRGILKERDVDYTMTSDGFRYIITTVDKQASRTEVTLLQIKE